MIFRFMLRYNKNEKIVDKKHIGSDLQKLEVPDGIYESVDVKYTYLFYINFF